MVTAKTQYNLKNAEQYFEEPLCVGDYYNEGQRVSGEWIGLGAERLGLAGKVRADDFLKPYVIRNPNRRIRVLAEIRQALENLTVFQQSHPFVRVGNPQTLAEFPPGCSSRTGRARPRVRQMVRRPSQGVWRQSSLSQ